MKERFAPGYTARGFAAIGIAALIAVITDVPGQMGEARGVVYFTVFAVLLATFETIARRKGWPGKAGR